MLFLRILFLLLVYFDTRAQILPAEGYGTVIMYHRFDENKYEDTSISSELFRSHLEFLKNEEYNVLPISKLVNFFTNDIALPKKSVFITIDDGFKSFYDKAFPLLKKYQFPFTVFVSTDHVGKNDNSNLEKALNIYKYLNEKKIDTIIDDTDENFSSKIKKFNLIGIPFQVMIGKKSEGDLFEFNEIGKEVKNLSIEDIAKIIINKKK